MARTSKRYLQTNKITKQDKIYYRAGIYTRLSNERSESWREKSSSIETQVLNCKEYALKENIEVVEVFTDYEYSGTNFERPAFIEMMDAIKTRKINCIIIRDLSRLGREHLEMGRLIDKVFPFLGVRFISVSDKVDTVKDTDSKKSFEITLKNIVNDMYAKDMSVKIKTSKHNRAKNGYFIGSVPPYGYKVKKLKEGQKLVVDENVRFIVEEMFRLTLEGKSQFQVAKKFNEKGYATGMTYYKTGRIYRIEGDPEWHKSTISKMIMNKSYTGTLVQGVKQQNLAKGHKQQYVPESEYIIFENAHEAIIPKDLHDRILKERLERKANHVFSSPMHDFERDYENRYKGLVINNNTGKELYRRTRIYGKNRDRLYYSFQNDTSNGYLKKEKRVFIMERDLDKAIADKISEILNIISKKDTLINRISYQITNANSYFEKEINKLNRKVAKEESIVEKEYENYSLGKTDKDSYKLKKELANYHIEIINEEILKFKNKKDDLSNQENKIYSWINKIFEAKGIEKLPTDLIHELVEKVLVYESHNFEVFFKFDIEKIKEAKYE